MFGTRWTNELEETLGRLFPTSERLAAAASGYAAFAVDVMRRQVTFEQAREYPAKSYAEAAQEVYFDDAYMSSEYLPGLLLSHFLWPHHYRQARFFESAYVDQMRVTGATAFAEVGCGTGLFSRRTLQLLPTVTGTGYDISPSSKAFTDHHLEAFGLSDRYRLNLQDIVDQPIEPVEWLICVEVLEHLEDPIAFLRVLRAALRPGGRGFITAALNAPHVDHIYLYDRPKAVLDQLVEAGFVLEQAFVGAAHPPRQPGLPVPTVAAFIVT